MAPDAASPCAAAAAALPTSAFAADSPQRGRVAPSSDFGAGPSQEAAQRPRGGAQYLREFLFARAPPTATEPPAIGKTRTEADPESSGAAAKEAASRREARDAETRKLLEDIRKGWGDAPDDVSGLVGDVSRKRSPTTLLQKVCALANATREQKTAGLRKLHHITESPSGDGETSLAGVVARDLAVLEAVERAAAPNLRRSGVSGRMEVGRCSGQERRNMPHGWLACVVGGSGLSGRSGKAEAGVREGEGQVLAGPGDAGK